MTNHDDGIPHPPSILYDGREPGVGAPADPDLLADLHLDQLIGAITRRRPDDDLASLYSTPLHHASTVRYRQAVLNDVADPATAAVFSRFGESMHRVRSLLTSAAKILYRHQRQGWMLEAANAYCDAVREVSEGFGRATLTSRAMQEMRDYLTAYTADRAFTALASEARSVQDALSEVRYALRIKGARITVSPYEGEPDYSAAVLETFAKFKQGAAKQYRVRFPSRDVNHIQAQILELVAELHPEPFAALDRFFADHPDFIDRGVDLFDREVRFYQAWLEFTEPLRAAGLPFCTPTLGDAGSEAADAFDVVLASQRGRVVTNDISLRGPERLMVVTGPNQGGKTTFARMVGQLYHLASLGLSVPARRATLTLPDRIFSLFERQERLDNLRGKLEDELVRFRTIVAQASGRSIVIMNETFSSTALEDARLLGRQVLEELTERGVIGVYVTFVDELASLSAATVSMVAQVSADDPTQRTFKVVRLPADGRAYALAIAAKHGLTYDTIRHRVAP